jgi:NitT/TauT family transport system substrate-binding protein
MILRSYVHRRVARLVLAAVVLCSILLAPSLGHLAPVRAAALPQATQLMNWFPEAEHGGFYAAQELKLYQKYGLDATIQPYSYAYKGLDALKEVALGKLTFAMANADDVYLARSRGLPVVAVFATMQNDLQCFMWHANDKSIPLKDPFAHFSGHTVIYGIPSTFWDFLMDKYHYTNIKTINYDFTLRDFALIPNSINQGYISEEPYTAEHSKPPIHVKAALVAEAGYNPYYEVIATTEDEIKTHPDVVRAYVAATVAGWKAYYGNHATTEKVNAYIRNDPTSKSFPLTPQQMDYAGNAVKSIVMGGEAKTHGIGYMDPARWVTLKKQLVGVGLTVGNVDPMSAFTDQFLPKM